jgi:hypothetical protein
MRFLLAFTLFVSTSAMAQFLVNPLVRVTPGLVSAEVYNPYYEPIFCEGFAQGLTFSRNILQARIADVIAPGTFRYAYVQTNPVLNPFIDGGAHVVCRFANRYYW